MVTFKNVKRGFIGLYESISLTVVRICTSVIEYGNILQLAGVGTFDNIENFTRTITYRSYEYVLIVTVTRNW